MAGRLALGENDRVRCKNGRLAIVFTINEVLFAFFKFLWAGFPIISRRYSGEGRRSTWLGLLFACILLFLGLTVLVNHAAAGDPIELRRRLDDAEAKSIEIGKIVEREGEVVRAIHRATDHELELRLRNQHRRILQKIGQLNKSKLRILSAAVELLSGYEPGSSRELEAAVREARRLVAALRLERDAILVDQGSSHELVVELGINILLERAEVRLRFLYDEEQKFAIERGVVTTRIEKTDKPELPEPEIEKAWFDRQETAVKVTLIGAIVSVIASLTGVIVAIIKRRSS